jgi:hypothetical protein
VLAVLAAAQDRPELQTKVNQSVRSASNPLQLSEQVVASSTPPNSLRRDHDYLYIGYDYDTCVVGANPPPVEPPPLAQSPSRVQEDSAERVEAMPRIEGSTEQLVQTTPRVGEN